MSEKTGVSLKAGCLPKFTLCDLISCAAAGVVALAAFVAFAQTGAPASRASTRESNRPAQTPVLSAITVEHKDIRYANADANLNVLDVYSPKGAAGAPVLMFIHGGEWTKGDKREISCKPKFFNENGVVFVSINYRLSPAARHPAQVDDVAAAIAWTKAHIGEYGGDGNQIVIMGHSAGCHLATLTALSPETLAKAKLKPSDIRGVVAWSGGMYDLADRAKGEGMYPPYIRATFGESEESQRAASPLAHAASAKGGPAFLFASVDEARSKNSMEAAQKMVDAITKAGGSAKHITLEGKSHFAANHELGAEGDKTGARLLEFVKSVTR